LPHTSPASTLAPSAKTASRAAPTATPRSAPSASPKEKGYQVKVGKFPFVGNSKATILDAHDGFVKIVSDAKYGEVLGVHIIGPQATELIAECVVAMELEATVEAMTFIIHAHPTLSESLLDGFGSVEGMAINV
jgi:dihydrolipoamide dehydrogenase